MKKVILSGAIAVLVITAQVFGVCTGSSPTWTCPMDSNMTSLRNLLSGSQAGLQRNDTINVSAGSATITSTISITVGLTITGAGSGSSTITSNVGTGNDMIDIIPDSTTISNSSNITISGFTLDANNQQVFTIMYIQGAADNATKPWKYFLIHDNVFKNTNSQSGGGNAGIYFKDGQSRGVIYSNTFTNVDMPVRVFGSDDTVEMQNSAYNSNPAGTADQVFMEDNTINYSSYSSSDGNAGWTETGQGGRFVERFNSWDLSGVTSGSQESSDIHGNQNFYNSPDGQTSTFFSEYYDNTWVNGRSSEYRWVDFRGGSGFIFDQVYSGASSPDIEINQYNGGCYSQIENSNGSAYTGPDFTVLNTYFWNNKVNGSLSGASTGSSNSCGVVENTNFYNQQTSFTGTIGVGRGVIASRPSTCTTGVGYWATDQGSWNTKLPANTSGQFYKCTATNTWTLYYTPYTYPNPLRSGSTYTITVSSITGHGTVTSSDAVINCTTGTTGTCSDSSATGMITLTETPSAGYVFTSWGGGTCAGASTTCSVTGTATVTATFSPTTITNQVGGFTISGGRFN